MKKVSDVLTCKKAVKFIAALTAMILAFSAYGGHVPAYSAEEAGESDLPYGGDFGPSEISNKIKGVSIYPSSNITFLSEEEAAERGLSKGYSGYVIATDKGTDVGVTFDFSAAKINVYQLKSIYIKMYIESTDEDVKTGDARYPEVRIPYPGINDCWAVRFDASSKTDRWITLVLYPDGKNMTSDAKKRSGSDNALMSLADKDGYLNKFEVAVRRHGGEGAFYIDTVKLTYKENDGNAPVLTYNGEDSIKLAKGAKMVIDASAYDENEQRDCKVAIGWAEGTALEEDGQPAVGTRNILVLSAADAFGNTATHRIEVEMLPPDETPPVIKTPSGKVKCVAGTTPQMRGEIEDDQYVDSVKYAWEDGALDSLGRLNEGTFQLKITATDTSGNVSEKIIEVVAGGTGIFDDFVVTEDEKR